VQEQLLSTTYEGWSTVLEATDPPESDIDTLDPYLVPREQDLRFAGDLYTPQWVRGHGNKYEGWCGLCKPGCWLLLKNGAFTYHKTFTHGISAATGAAFRGPQDTRRTQANLNDVWEGLCGSCGEWIALSSNRRAQNWFRHAYEVRPQPNIFTCACYSPTHMHTFSTFHKGRLS
jgi:hypothetical protein